MPVVNNNNYGVSSGRDEAFMPCYVVSMGLLAVVAVAGGWHPVAFLLIPVVGLFLAMILMFAYAMLMVAGSLAVTGAVIAGVVGLGYYAFLIILPAAFQVPFGGLVEFLKLIFGNAESLMRQDPFLSNVMLAAFSGMATGTALGVWKRYVSKSWLVKAFVKAVFSKDLVIANPAALQPVVLGSLVGLVVGALGGASGLMGIFSTGGALDMTPAQFLREYPTALASAVGAGGFGGIGEGFFAVLAACIFVFLVSLLSSIMVGVVVGIGIGALQGAVVGFVKGAVSSAYQASADAARHDGSPGRVNYPEATFEGAKTGALCGLIIGCIHGVITIIGAVGS